MKRLLVSALAFAAATAAAFALEPLERSSVATLPEVGNHWVWVPDRLFQHSMLFDGDTGVVLGMIDSGVGVTPKLPQYSRSRREIYSVDTAYSRGKRGDRVDFVTVYDAIAMDVIDEVLLPTRTADSNTSLTYVALLDGDAFLTAFNQFPNASVSVVDVEGRRFVEEIIVTGCAGIYPVDERRFAMLCGDGTIIAVALDSRGHKAGFSRSEPFFDVVADPVAMAAARDGQRWFFVSFEGYVHEVDFSAGAPRVTTSWSLLDEDDRAANWRVGGLQDVAFHRGSRRLYTVMHQGGLGSHKEPGPEIWVYDASDRARVARFAVPNLTAAFLGSNMGIDAGSFWDWMLQLLIPNAGVHTIAVTQDDHPLLFTRHAGFGSVGVLDAKTGEHIRNLDHAGLTGPTLAVP